MKTNNSLRIALMVILLACSVFTSAQTSPPPTTLCMPGGYLIGFFNGVLNTQAEAYDGLENIEILYALQYGPNNEPIKYDLFYNDSGKNNNAALGWFEDCIEVFQQRAAEQGGALANRWELFWELLHSNSEATSLSSIIVAGISNLAATINNAIADMRTKEVAALGYLVSNPPTLQNYAEHKTRLDAHITQQEKLILIAHSQGNLFMNVAYEYAAPKVTENSVKAVHIAPASTHLHGEYTLTEEDLVIGLLQSLLPAAGNPVPNKHEPRGRLEDLSGHELVPSYLNAAYSPYQRIKTTLGNALRDVQTPASQSTIGGQTNGFFTVTLTWNGTGDVDLHTFEPNGTHVYYGNRVGQSGVLDTDNTVANGPEHYFATCDATMLQIGTYEVGINDYANAAGRTATVQVASYQDGLLATKSLDVGPVRGGAGNSSPLHVFNVQVTKNAQGNFTVGVQ